MSKKIIGVTVGTPISPSKLQQKLNPVKTVNGKSPDANGNVKVDTAEGMTLGVHTDGLIYLFKNGAPQGVGLEIRAEEVEGGDVVGYIDENNNIVVKGNLADGTYSVKYEMEDGSFVSIGNLVLDSNVYYKVTYGEFTNCTINNSVTQVVEGGSYSATITANSGYELSSVNVTMGGSPVTVTNGVINILNVTGDIAIKATATVVEAAIDNGLFNPSTAKLNYRLKSGGTEEAYDGAFYTQDYIPVSSANQYLCIKGCTVSDESINPHSICGVWYYTADKTLKGKVEAMLSYSAMKNLEIVDATNLIYKILLGVDYNNKALSYASEIAYVRLVLTTNAKGDRSKITSSAIEKIVIKLDEIIS